MANLKLKHLYKVYPNGTKAVNDFTMDIEDKEFIVFVGPSGCGKSTTLRMIAGLEDITYGELMIGDEVVNGLEPKDRDIAMVFQNYALYPHVNIYENIAFGLRSRHVPKEEIDQKVKEVARTLGIETYLNKKPKEMSGGQRQRVALGRAIVREPKVMLLDEPLSNLDAKLRTQMRSEIVKLHKKLQTTFIYVTHDQVEAMTMGTRIVVMKDGFVQQIDTPKNLYKHPSNRFVASFIGSPQMNFFRAKLSKVKEGVKITFLDFEGSLIYPASSFNKMSPSYTEEEKEVILGVRAEHVIRSKSGLPMKVSHVEELGNETLIYGDFDLTNESIGESKTKVIFKVGGYPGVEFGDILHLSLVPEGLHFFDPTTEESILKRIPDPIPLPVEVKNGSLISGDWKRTLPPSLPLEDGRYEMEVPLDAITLRPGNEADVVFTETVDKNKELIELSIHGSPFFVLASKAMEGKVDLDIDLARARFLSKGIEILKPLQTLNEVEGKFLLEKKKVGFLKYENHYFLSFLSQKEESPKNVTTKMCMAYTNRTLFHETFAFYFPSTSIHLASDGIQAKVLERLDYGSRKFLKIQIEGKELIMEVEAFPESEVIYVSFDFETMSVKEIRRDINII